MKSFAFIVSTMFLVVHMFIVFTVGYLLPQPSNLILVRKYAPCSELKLPKSVITCKTLVVLKVRVNLGLCDPNLNLTSTSSLFPSLKSLHYTDYNPDNASLEKLLSNCHALEDLTIDGCIFGKRRLQFQDLCTCIENITNSW